MRFLHKHYPAKKREILEVEIDQPVKVKFMTAFDFELYKKGKTHRYFGGLFEESPVRFVIPFESVWIVVVEKGTHYAPIDVKANCRNLPPDRQMLSSVASDAPESVRKAHARLNGAADVPAEMSEGETHERN